MTKKVKIPGILKMRLIVNEKRATGTIKNFKGETKMPKNEADLKIPELGPSELEPVELNDGKIDNARLDLIRSRAAKLKAKERDLAPAQVSMAGTSELGELIGAVRDLSNAVLAAAAIPALVERCGRRLDERWVSKAAIAIGTEVMRGISGKEKKHRMGRPRKAKRGKND